MATENIQSFAITSDSILRQGTDYIAKTNIGTGKEIRLLSAGIPNNIGPDANIIDQLDIKFQRAINDGSPIIVRAILNGWNDFDLIGAQAIGEIDHIDAGISPSIIDITIRDIARKKIGCVQALKGLIDKYDHPLIQIDLRSSESLGIGYEAISINDIPSDEHAIEGAWIIAPNQLGMTSYLCAAQVASELMSIQISKTYDRLWLISEPIAITAIPAEAEYITKISGALGR